MNAMLRTAEDINKMFFPYQDISAAIQSNNFLSNLYPSVQDISNQLSACRLDTSSATAILDSLSYINKINTSWLDLGNDWALSKDLVSNMDISGLTEINSPFASLIKLEQETSLLPTIPENLISVSSQIASIASITQQNLLSNTPQLFEPLLSDYCELATKQYSMINKSLIGEDIEWRLGVLDAASKYVDRQVSWTSSFVNDISELENDTDIAYLGRFKEYESGVSLIPKYIGYTKRADNNKTPLEGLSESTIVEITEKGKIISGGIITINRLAGDSGKDRVLGIQKKSSKPC